MRAVFQGDGLIMNLLTSAGCACLNSIAVAALEEMACKMARDVVVKDLKDNSTRVQQIIEMVEVLASDRGADYIGKPTLVAQLVHLKHLVSETDVSLPPPNTV
jgi:ankyrin repeat protein